MGRLAAESRSRARHSRRSGLNHNVAASAIAGGSSKAPGAFGDFAGRAGSGESAFGPLPQQRRDVGIIRRQDGLRTVELATCRPRY